MQLIEGMISRVSTRATGHFASSRTDRGRDSVSPLHPCHRGEEFCMARNGVISGPASHCLGAKRRWFWRFSPHQDPLTTGMEESYSPLTGVSLL